MHWRVGVNWPRTVVLLYTSIYDCRHPASALKEALDVIEARDKQVDNLLRGMEELNREGLIELVVRSFMSRGLG
eukprot:scaffold51757_cov42-Cyclotella_meneghiniana.AAC.6